MRNNFRRWLLRWALGACWSLGAALLAPTPTPADPPAKVALGVPGQPAPGTDIGPLLLSQYHEPKVIVTGDPTLPPAAVPQAAIGPTLTPAGMPHATIVFEATEPPLANVTPPSASAKIVTFSPDQDAVTVPAVKPGPLPSAVLVSPAAANEAAKPMPHTQQVPAAAPVATIGPFVQFPRTEFVPQRKAYLDLTAAPCFAHAPDYAWIVGRVEYSSINKQWRLRYASVDEVDRFGGHVVLVQNQHVAYLVDGMLIQVRGHLVNPDSTGPAYYRIEWFQSLKDPNLAPATTPAP
jgi:hypothetical protein